jgi:hypothetical protein
MTFKNITHRLTRHSRMRALLAAAPLAALSIAIGSATPVVPAATASARPQTYCLGHVINGVCYRQFPPGQG